MISAKRWTKDLSLAQFEKVTGRNDFPEFLKKDVADNKLKVYSNGEFVYKLKGKVAKVTVTWNFEAPKGGDDIHFSIMRGKLCNLMIKQEKEQNYNPNVYIETNITEGLITFEVGLKKAVDQDNATKYPGLKLEKLSDNIWTVEIPSQYKLGHEAHFGHVTAKYLQYLKDGKLPEWEVPNMIAKYYTTTEVLKLAKQKKINETEY